MKGRKKSHRRRRAASRANRSAPHPAPDHDARPDDRVSESILSLHELFAQQTRAMLERSDLDEEQKQNILIAMSCPCCGAGAMSYTVKLRR
jgi:hypothetical protein